MPKQETIRSTPAKGTRDFLPEEALLRDWACEIIKKTYRQYGFTSIETPIIENISLLKRGEGGENLSLIFEILKRGEKLEKVFSGNGGKETDLSDFGLRFDLTVPLVRYYANNVNDLPTPFKAIQIGPVFRAERPQKGRFRQFTQCDIDIIGLKSHFAELDLLNATCDALLNLGLKDFTLRVNDRVYLQNIADWCGFDSASWEKVFIAIDKLDKIGIEGVKKELASQSASSAAIDKLEQFYNSIVPILSDSTLSGIKQVESLKNVLPDIDKDNTIDSIVELVAALSNSSGGYSVVFDPTLVRGMGYYTGTIFEVSVSDYGFSVAGGGRYDKMIEKFLGREVPACGFSIGFERIISILQEKKYARPDYPELTALIFDEKRDTLELVMQAFNKLKAQSDNVSLTPKRKDLKKQLDQLAEGGFGKFCIFRGDPDNLEVKSLEG